MDGVVEIITGREGRRRWSTAEKLRIVAETQEPGVMIRAVAARHDVCESLLFTSRRPAAGAALIVGWLHCSCPGAGGVELISSSSTCHPALRNFPIDFADPTIRLFQHSRLVAPETTRIGVPDGWMAMYLRVYGVRILAPCI